MVISNFYFFDKFGKNLNLDWDSTDSFWKGTIFFPEVSTYLFDNENLFILEKVSTDYGFPQLASGDNISFEWEIVKNEKEVFLYEVEKDVTLDNLFIDIKETVVVSYSDLYATPPTSNININLPLQVNIAFNPKEEVNYKRKLLVYTFNDSAPTVKTKVAEIEIYGEGLDEDERFGVWARNFGIKFNKEDANILKDYDIKEAFPDWSKLNNARKNLLVNKDQVFPYIGTYKGLSNFVNLLGYKDVLQVKEYWKNINTESSYFKKHTLVDITDYLDDGKIDNMNILDKNKNIKFGKQFRKTECLALVYQFTKESGVFDDDGIPIVEETTDFTVNEMFYKLNNLKDKLKDEIIPINVKIKDIIGEFIYFQKITVKFWSDRTPIVDINMNDKSEIVIYPDENVNLIIRSLSPLLRKDYTSGIDFGEFIINTSGRNPYEDSQKYNAADIPAIITYIKKFYAEIKKQRYPNIGSRLTWEQGDDPEKVVGAPIILDIDSGKFTFSNFKGVSFSDLQAAGGLDPYYTLENIDFKNFYEITWKINKEDDNSYNFSYRGKIKDIHQLPHFLPRIGTYRITVELHDFGGNTSVFSKFLTVEDIKPEILAVTRLEDKFEYKIDNLDNIQLIDFGASYNYYPKANILDNEDSVFKINMYKSLLEWVRYYQNNYGAGRNLLDVELYNDVTDTYVPITDPAQNHSYKSYWGLGESRIPLSLSDFDKMSIDSMFYQRICNTVYTDDVLAGFYMWDPVVGDEIGISSYSPYTIPSFATLQDLVDDLNASTHKGIKRYNYELLDTKVDGIGLVPGGDYTIGTDTTFPYPSPGTGNRNFEFVDGGNGFAYSGPGTSGVILKLNLSDDTLTTVGSFPAGGTPQFKYGIKSPTTNKIYFFPDKDHGSTADVLVIDPLNSDAITSFSWPYSTGITDPCITPSGIIYANTTGPAGNEFYKIDTNTEIVTVLPTVSTFGGGHAIYSQNDFVYILPQGGNGKVYKLDPINDSFLEILTPSLTFSLDGVVETSSGIIYGLHTGIGISPLVGKQFFKLNTLNDTSNSFISADPQNNYPNEIMILPDDSIYVIHYNTRVLKLDTLTDTTSIVLNLPGTGAYQEGNFIGDAIYSIAPNGNQPVLKISFSQALVPEIVKIDKTVIHAQAEYFSKEMYHTLSINLSSSGVISGDTMSEIYATGGWELEKYNNSFYDGLSLTIPTSVSNVIDTGTSSKLIKDSDGSTITPLHTYPLSTGTTAEIFKPVNLLNKYGVWFDGLLPDVQGVLEFDMNIPSGTGYATSNVHDLLLSINGNYVIEIDGIKIIENTTTIANHNTTLVIPVVLDSGIHKVKVMFENLSTPSQPLDGKAFSFSVYGSNAVSPSGPAQYQPFSPALPSSYADLEQYEVFNLNSLIGPPASSFTQIDEYTFHSYEDAYSPKTIDHLKNQSAKFNPEMLFMFAKTSDMLNGNVDLSSFWKTGKYMEINSDIQKGFIPTVFDQNSFNISDIKIYDSSFTIPENCPMFFNVNNVDGKLEYIWTLIDSNSEEEIIRVTGVPFFVWKFKDIGNFKLKVEVTDNKGSIYESEIDRLINVVNKLDYSNHIEKRLDRRKIEILNKIN